MEYQNMEDEEYRKRKREEEAESSKRRKIEETKNEMQSQTLPLQETQSLPQQGEFIGVFSPSSVQTEAMETESMSSMINRERENPSSKKPILNVVESRISMTIDLKLIENESSGNFKERIEKEMKNIVESNRNSSENSQEMMETEDLRITTSNNLSNSIFFCKKFYGYDKNSGKLECVGKEEIPRIIIRVTAFELIQSHVAGRMKEFFMEFYNKIYKIGFDIEYIIIFIIEGLEKMLNVEINKYEKSKKKNNSKDDEVKTFSRYINREDEEEILAKLIQIEDTKKVFRFIQTKNNQATQDIISALLHQISIIYK